MRKNRIIGAKYLPTFFGEWQKGIPYAPLTMVTFKGDSYISKKEVPVSIDISNNGYWERTGQYNAQLENYIREVRRFYNETNEKIDKLNYFCTPQQFGAKGNGLHDDSESLQQAINYCINNKYTLKGFKDSVYKISKPIIIKGKLDIDLVNTKILCTNANSRIEINTPSLWREFGNIQNITIDCNNIADKGLYIISGYKSTIKNLTILNANNIGYQIDKGFENVFDTFRIFGKGNRCIGIVTNGDDCHYDNMFGFDCHTFIQNKGLNFFHNVHAWIYNPSLFRDSTFINQINGMLFLNNIYCDTYYKCFNYTADSKNTYINNLCYIFNENLWNISSQPSTPYVFFFENKNYQETITIKNSMIKGTTFDSSYLHNLQDNEFKVNIDDSTVINYIKNGYKKIVSENLTCTNENFVINSQSIIKRNGNVELNLNIKVNTSDITLGKQYSIITLPSNFIPINSFQTYGDISDSEWGIGEKLSYFYIGNAISIIVPTEITGTKYIRLHTNFLTK